MAFLYETDDVYGCVFTYNCKWGTPCAILNSWAKRFEE